MTSSTERNLTEAVTASPTTAGGHAVPNDSTYANVGKSRVFVETDRSTQMKQTELTWSAAGGAAVEAMRPKTMMGARQLRDSSFPEREMEHIEFLLVRLVVDRRIS